MSWDRFTDLMDIPETMRLYDIERFILKPAVKELQEPQTLFNTKSQPFKSLSYKKTKTKGQGNKITGIEFYFLPETECPKELEQAQKDLQYLAMRDKQEQLIKQFAKENQIKLNPFTGQQVDELKSFVGKHFAVYNKLLNAYDACKITNLQKALVGLY